MGSIPTLLHQLRSKKIDESFGIQWHTQQRINNIEELLDIISQIMTILQTSNDNGELRQRCLSVGIKLRNIIIAYKGDAGLIQKIKSSGEYSVSHLNQEIDEIINHQLQAQSGSKIWLITDESKTPFGHFLAEFINWSIVQSLKDAPDKNPFLRMIEKGGYANSLYERIHQPSEKDIQTIYSRQHQEVRQLLPGVQSDKVEESYKQYLYANIEQALAGTILKYSKSMSQQQQFNMLWIRTFHIDDFDNTSDQHRIYLNVKFVKILEAARFIATQVTDFLSKNSQIQNYIFVKYKFRTLLTESDRADMCIVYIKLRKGIESHSSIIVKAITDRISALPQEDLNLFTSPLLKQIKPGITAVDDSVKYEKSESYTSQIFITYYAALKKYSTPVPASEVEMQTKANQVIKFCIHDLRQRGYPY